MAEIVVDAKNLLCPMPVIRLQKAIADAKHSDVIKTICTDPGALHDIPAWSRIHGHKLIEKLEEDGEYIVLVEVQVE